MGDNWLRYTSLSDHYERKARFLPGLLSLLPALPLGAAYGVSYEGWLALLASTVGVGTALAVLLAHLSSALGNRLQRKLWPDWPHDAPTHRWLQPDSEETSAQQRAIWYEAIRALTGLDIAAAAGRDDAGETRRVINDAVAALRTRVSRAPEGERVRLHLTDFGFARNLTALRPVWIPLSVLSAAGCWAGVIWLDCSLVWAVVSTGVAVVALPVGWFVLPDYVRLRSRQYAESFFEALVLLAPKGGAPPAVEGPAKAT
jgi:hypothetical protein